jgi:hypothetical protein
MTPIRRRRRVWLNCRIWQEIHRTSKDTSVRALLSGPLPGMPLRNTLTSLRGGAVRGASAFVKHRRKLNGTRSPTSMSIHGLGVRWEFQSGLQIRSAPLRDMLNTFVRLPRARHLCRA